jgi:hypothetical protein
MTTRKTLMLAALISIAPAGLVMAQSGSSPQDPGPASASSPAATGAPTTTDNSSPSASTPKSQHHMANKQAMKDCVAKQQSDNQGMSATDAKKACKQQMKGSG